MDNIERPETSASDAREEDTQKVLPFPVVGVGASAGGLEAFTELLESLPPNPGVAFLFVLHLQPHRKSQLSEILTTVTPLTVLEAVDGQEIEKDHIYLIPPDMHMAIEGRNIALVPRPGARGDNMPADHLFRSLAYAQKQNSIGVILSGGGTDGSLGFQAIKGKGGITFAQDEATAKQANMPRTAIIDGTVDFILSPEQIGQQISQLGALRATRTMTKR